MKKLLISIVMMVCTLGVFAQSATLIVKENSYYDRYPVELREESPYNMVSMPAYLKSEAGLTFTVDIPNKEGAFFRFSTSMILFLKPGTTLTLDYAPRNYFDSKFEGDLAKENRWLNGFLLKNPSEFLMKDGVFFRTDDYKIYAENINKKEKEIIQSLDQLQASDFFVKNMRKRIDFLTIAAHIDFLNGVLMRTNLNGDGGSNEKAQQELKDKIYPQIKKEAIKIYKKYSENEVIETRQGCYSLCMMAMFDKDFHKNLGFNKFDDIYTYSMILADPNYMFTPDFLAYSKGVKDKVLMEKIELFINENRHMFSGETPKDTEFLDLEGKKCKLSDFKGSVLYIDFWATWCNPCKALSPSYGKLAERMAGHNIKFIAVSIDNKAEVWQKYMAKNPHHKEVIELYNNDKDFIHWFAIHSIPRFIIIDKNFKIRYAYAAKPFEQNHDNVVKILEQLENE